MREHNPLPSGTPTIAVGLAVNGLATYGFLVAARRALGDEVYGGLAVLWGLVFILGPGLFQPLEQELARATAERGSRGVGSAPVLRKAGTIGAAQLVAVVVGVLALWPLGLDRLLDHRTDLLAALCFALAAFAGAELVRGVVAGRHRFVDYGWYFAVEGATRMGFAVLLAVIGVRTVGWFGLAVGLGFAVAVGVTLLRVRPLAHDGPDAEWRELTPALAFLLATALCEAFLLNIGPVAVAIVGDELGDEAPGVFLNGLIIARIPLFFFQAVKASLLPNLAALAGRGDLDGFRQVQLRLLAAVTVLAAGTVASMALVGPFLVEVLFGDQLSWRDMGLLAAGGGGLMIMLSLSLGLVALGHTNLAAGGFVLAAATFPLALMLAEEPFLRVELALVVSVTVGAVTIAALLRLQYAAHRAAGRLRPKAKAPTGTTPMPTSDRTSR